MVNGLRLLGHSVTIRSNSKKVHSYSEFHGERIITCLSDKEGPSIFEWTLLDYLKINSRPPPPPPTHAEKRKKFITLAASYKI